MSKEVAYLDNNGTTMMSGEAVDAALLWTNRGNPSAGYPAAAEARRMMAAFRDYVAEVGQFRPDDYEVLFTSGGSEANAHILTGCVRAFRAQTGLVPRIVTSQIEHASILETCREMERLGEAEVVYLAPETDPREATFGMVSPASLAAALAEKTDRTCLVSVMAANNETGAINDVYGLAEVAAKAKVPFHTDAVQMFGKGPVRPDAVAAAPIDAFSASFHKLEGPLGCGLLVVRRSFLKGYAIPPLVGGAQNGGYRGGTENLAAIGGSYTAYRTAMTGRSAKNAHLREMTEAVWDGLRRAKGVEAAGSLAAYVRGDLRPTRGAVLVRILGEARGSVAGGAGRATTSVAVGKALPNTLLVAVVLPSDDFCNIRAQRALGRRGVYVGIGSTCHSAASGHKEISHVVTALDLPKELRPGILRFSVGDGTKKREVQLLRKTWEAVLASGECLMDGA